MISTLLALHLLAAADPGRPLPAQSRLSLGVGVRAGAPHLVGLSAAGSLELRSGRALELDALWEPSAQLQSYSLGAALRGRLLSGGARVRWLQFHAPWTRGFQPGWHDHLGLGLEGGLHWLFGPRDRLRLGAGVAVSFVPTQAPGLQWLLGAHVGAALTLFDVALPARGP